MNHCDVLHCQYPLKQDLKPSLFATALRELLPSYIEGKLIRQFMKGVLTIGKMRISIKCNYLVSAVDNVKHLVRFYNKNIKP